MTPGGSGGGLGLRKAANGADTNSPRNELVSLAAHYAAVAALLPLPIFGAAVLLSGLMSATIVTVSHQTEDLILDREPDWVLNQFVSTRDCRTSNPFSEWLWGGMQYQLIHHLMPTLPRYHYRKIRPLVRAFAKENGVEYREMDELPLLARNIALYRDVARAPADPTARSSSGGAPRARADLPRVEPNDDHEEGDHDEDVIFSHVQRRWVVRPQVWRRDPVPA